MPSRLKATAYAAYTLSTLSLYAVVTNASHTHGGSRLDRGLGVSKRATMSYNGCYSSSDGLTDQGSYTYQTTSYCQPICVGKNNAVFGLSGGSDCWCGDTLPPTDSKVDDSKCDTPCNGYGSDDCGGTGYYSVYLTGTEDDVSHASSSGSSSDASSAGSSSTTSAASSATSASASSNDASTTTAASLSSTNTAQIVTTSVEQGTTVLVTMPAAATSTASSTPTAQNKGSHTNVAGIAAGVVVGVVAIAAIIAGVVFWLRRKRKQEAEGEYKKTQVSDFMAGGRSELKPPPSAYSQMSDSRLDPEAGARRNSVGSIADDQDYSRRILRVRN